MSPKRVFVSYSSGADRNGDRAREIAAALRVRGAEVWEASEHVSAGSSIADEIDAAIRASDAVVALVAREDVAGPWLYWELGAAVALGRQVIPVIDEDLEAADLPAPLRLRLFVRWSNAESVAERIVAALQREPAPAS